MIPMFLFIRLCNRHIINSSLCFLYELQIASVVFMVIWTIYAAYTASLGEVTTVGDGTLAYKVNCGEELNLLNC